MMVKDKIKDAIELMKIAQRLLEVSEDTLEDIIEGHENIIASDEQYDDPELWWARPLIRKVERAKLNLIDNVIELEGEGDE